MPIILTNKPGEVVERLLAVLPDRSREVLENRFGLIEGKESQTLEAIGKKHGITRERVRQIENFAIQAIRKSDQYDEEQKAFVELKDAMHSHGGIVEEENFLGSISDQETEKNRIRLLLILGDHFNKLKEDKHFHHRWSMDERLTNEVHLALHKLHDDLTHEHLISEEEIVKMLLNHIDNIPETHRQPEIAKNWLAISKILGKNPLNDWGLPSSPNVSVRGIRDYAFLVLRKNSKPMHFTEVARDITEQFGKKAHTATCHNELIKDPRFVLVGRGLYGLSEWGYSNGVVREVIRELLRKNGPLDKNEIIEEVLKERFVKENTVLVNLQNDSYFKRLGNGKFTLA